MFIQAMSIDCKRHQSLRIIFKSFSTTTQIDDSSKKAKAMFITPLKTPIHMFVQVFS